MIQTVSINHARRYSLDGYAVDPQFTPAVSDLRAEVGQLRARLDGRRVFMINSTAQGGGVAEMMPQLVYLLRELGLTVDWLTINTDRREFFVLTKRLHNLIHGDARAGLALGPDDARLYEAVNRENAESLKPQLRPGDLLVVHDPQPLPLGGLLKADLGLPFVWRCHIGLDQHTEATHAAWDFLRPYLGDCAHAVFSAPEYIPSFLAGRSSILYPSLDPMSHKNRHLSIHKMIGILCNSGLQEAHDPVPTPNYRDRVRRVQPDGSLRVAGSVGLLFRPIVLQVSRWDRLKGWQSLLAGFLKMKRDDHAGNGDGLRPRDRNRLSLARLVLAGPDPDSIQDDPEGLAVFEELKTAYAALSPREQEDVIVLSLPMAVRKENALIVNALQRCASVVVQNSLREGFGLTVTEAMWKRQAVLGTRACGIRLQLRDRIDGRLTTDPEDPAEIAQALTELLTRPAERYRYGRSARRRVHREFLIFRQLADYVRILSQLAAHTGSA